MPNTGAPIASRLHTLQPARPLNLWTDRPYARREPWPLRTLPRAGRADIREAATRVGPRFVVRRGRGARMSTADGMVSDPAARNGHAPFQAPATREELHAYVREHG